MRELPRLIVVTGPPGAGKTTIAGTLRDRLGLPLIAKDALKETLGDALAVRGGDREESRRLGAATFEVQLAVVRELLAAGGPHVVEGNFAVERAPRLFGGLPPARITQVHVTSAPATLREWMVSPNTPRHPAFSD